MTWSEMDALLPNYDVRALAYFPSPGLGRGSALFVGTTGGVFKSSDLGETWTDCNNGLGDCMDVRTLLVSPGLSGMEVRAGTWGGGAFLSTDSGASWTSINVGLTDGYVRSLAALGGTLFAGTERGIFRDDGTGWVAVDSGLTSTFVRALAVHGSDLYAGTWANGVFHSSNGGADWTPQNFGLSNRHIRSLSLADTVLLAGTEGSGVFRSTNKGKTWPWNNTDRGYFYALAYSEGVLYAGTEGGTLLSSNKGVLWTAYGPWVSFYTITVRPPDGGTGSADIFAGSWTDGIFRSSDGGAHWLSASSGLPFTVILSVAAIPAADGSGRTDLLAGTWGSGVYLSTDRGTTWTPTNTGLTASCVYALAVAERRIVAGTRGGGVFLSIDGGISWTDANEGLGDLDIVSLAVTGTDLIAGTEGGGVWRRPLAELRPAGIREVTVPASARLDQNYPNPFNPATTIRYALPVRSSVTLAVYNVLGEKVVDLVHGEVEAGYHEVEFDAGSLASGVYLYRLQTLDFTQTRSLILLR